MADLSVVMDKLHGFETADDLAEFFRGYGIKARPQKSDTCAVSQFVKIETGLEYVVTTTEQVYVAGTSKMYTTPAMQEFIYKYDKGEYPDLIEEGHGLSKFGCVCCE